MKTGNGPRNGKRLMKQNFGNEAAANKAVWQKNWRD